jgi:hypothetical protein
VTYICVVLVSLCVALGQTSVTPVPKKTAPSADIFSGTVTKLTDESVTVVRKVAGHDAVTREFMRAASTKVEGKLREKVRVTVRYKAGEGGGFVAVYIIVR